MKAFHLPSLRPRFWLVALVCTIATAWLPAQPLIINIVETGGDNEATDTITAKWTGVPWNTTVANEPLLNTPAGTPFTAPVFGEDVPCFVDRAHQWNGATPELPLPDYLLGGEYIMSGNDNRDNPDYQLEVTVSDAAIVYIFIDNRYPNGKDNGTPPNFDEGLDPANWTTALSWLGTEGFKPVMNGLNRAGDPTWPDEIGADEGGDGIGPGEAINQWSSVYSKTLEGPGTFKLFQPDNAGRNMYGAVVKRLPNSVNNAPEVSGLTPANNTLFYVAAGGVSFTATTVSPNTIAPGNIKLILNDADVSANLTVGGSGTRRTVSYAGLQTDTLYTGRIIVADQAGRTTTNTFVFDTFNAATTTAIEAEDYNYESGKFLATPIPGGYAALLGVRDIDFHNNNGTATATVYRVGDYVPQIVATDVARKAFTDLGATDHQLTTVLAGDWWNYTRSLGDNAYRVYLRASSPTPQRVRLDRVGGDPGTINQTTSALGTFTVAPGNAAFIYAPLADAAGTPVVIRLSGNTTLRLTAQAASVNLQLNYLLLVPTSAPTTGAYLAAASPATGAANVAPDTTLNLALANGASAVNEGSLSLSFNGQDVSSSAVKTPVAGGILVNYDPPGMLDLAATQAVRVAFSDAAGNNATYAWTFTTLSNLVTIPDNFGTPPGSGQSRGFSFKIRKAPNTDSFGTAFTLANTTARANDQLADKIIDPETGAPYINEAPGPSNNGLGTTSLVNYDQYGMAAGFIGGDAAYPYVDTSFIADPNNIAMEFTAYVELAAGIHRFGVRSDDGFQLTCGPTFAMADATLVLGQYEGGRGDGLPGGETTFEFAVATAGVYPVRLIYYEGNGDARIEFYSINRETLARTLINDPSAGAVKAFTSRSAQIYVPTVSITSPAEGTVFPIAPTNITLTANASVVNGTISRVEFFYGASNKIGEATSAPFQAVWNNAKRGFYLLTAKATDTKGLTAVSTPVYIAVGRPLIANVLEINGLAEPTDTVVATWTGQMFSNGVAGEFLDPIRIPPFGEDVPAMVDRIHQWNGATTTLPIPSYLLGGEYILSGNDNRDAIGYQLDITLSEEALVYMLVDNRLGETLNADPPNYPDWTGDRDGDGLPDMQWLLQSGWMPVTNGLNRTSNKAWPDEVGVDEAADGVGPGGNINQWSSVYVKRVPAGTFSIYAADNTGQNMYGVVVTAIPTVTTPPVLNRPVLSGGTITITWSGGRLQEANDVTGQWTDVPGNPQGTYSVPAASAARKFYRAVAP